MLAVFYFLSRHAKSKKCVWFNLEKDGYNFDLSLKNLIYSIIVHIIVLFQEVSRFSIKVIILNC